MHTRQTKKQRRAQRQMEKKMRAIQEQIDTFQQTRVREINMRQYVALLESGLLSRCPATGRMVDPVMVAPRALTGPYFSQPFGRRLRSKNRRQWLVTPVLVRTCGAIIPAAATMWASSEVPA